MKKLFLVLFVCFSFSAMVAHASNGDVDISVSDATLIPQNDFVVSEALSLNITGESSIPPIQFISSKLLPPLLSEKIVEDTDKTNPILTQAQNETGPGTGPDTAPQIPPGYYYRDALATTGAQHWFYTQSDKDGQMIIHLDVPANTVNYDLYVYSYDPSTGNLYNFKGSAQGVGVSEHISFVTAKDSYYFILVHSAQGGGSSQYYYLHVETTNLVEEEIDDSPETARMITSNLNNIVDYVGQLSMRTDEDYFKLITLGNGVTISLLSNNANTCAEIFKLNGSNLDLIGGITSASFDKIARLGRVPYFLRVAKNSTCYIRVRHINNKNAYKTNDNYTLKVSSFNNSVSLSDAVHLGGNINRGEVVYIANHKLYINSQFIMDVPYGLEPLCKYHFEESDSTFRKAYHDSYASSPVALVLHVSYNISGGGMGVSSMPDALAIFIRGEENDLGIYFKNQMTSYRDPVKGTTTNNPSRYTQMDYTKSGAFILDLADKKVKDLASNGNGFYNGFFGNGYSFTITEK